MKEKQRTLSQKYTSLLLTHPTTFLLPHHYPTHQPTFQTSTEMKIEMYNRAIEYFDRGQFWERAITPFRTLRAYYEEMVYDYEAVGKLLEKEACYFRKMATQVLLSFFIFF